MRAYFRTMYELTGEEDFLWLATGRKEGKAPEQRNYKYTDAGIYVMRTAGKKMTAISMYMEFSWSAVREVPILTMIQACGSTY